MKQLECPNCQISFGADRSIKSRGFKIFVCQKCLNGTTIPIPKNLDDFYQDSYWSEESLTGKLKSFIYQFFQKRRKVVIEKYLTRGSILDVGAGEAVFQKMLDKRFIVKSLDVPGAKIINTQVLKVDFLNWRSKEKYNAVTFWESLEHVPMPQKYLEKAFKLLKPGSVVLVEYPRFQGLESRLFGHFWYHLDTPRHLVHLTDPGLKTLLARAGFKIIKSESSFAPEYSIIGFMGSLLNVFNINLFSTLSNKSNHQLPRLPLILLLSPLIIVSIIAEGILAVTGQSPIGLMIGQKVKK